MKFELFIIGLLIISIMYCCIYCKKHDSRRHSRKGDRNRSRRYCNSNKLFTMGTYSKYTPLPITKPNATTYIAIVRHGTRYPTKKMYKKLDTSISKTIHKHEIGLLTPDGLMEMVDYGKQLYKTYPYIFRYPERYEILSTEMERALQSAQACLNGINDAHPDGNITESKNIIRGVQINAFLKVKDFFIKEPSEPKIVSCQYSKILKKEYAHCDDIAINKFEKRRNALVYESAIKNHAKGEPIYNVIQKLINVRTKNIEQITSATPQGFVFFCHDSTLMPLYYLLGLLPKDASKYDNQDWLVFASRLEIIIDNQGVVRYYVNDREEHVKKD
jgi:hypothetical protein